MLAGKKEKEENLTREGGERRKRAQKQDIEIVMINNSINNSQNNTDQQKMPFKNTENMD